MIESIREFLILLIIVMSLGFIGFLWILIDLFYIYFKNELDK